MAPGANPGFLESGFICEYFKNGGGGINPHHTAKKPLEVIFGSPFSSDRTAFNRNTFENITFITVICLIS